MAIFFEAMLLLECASGVLEPAQGRFTEPLLLVVWAHGGAAGGAQYSDLRDRGGAARGRGDSTVAAAAAGDERGRRGCAPRPADSTGWLQETGETEADRRAGTWSASRGAAGGRAGVRAASAEEVPRRVRSQEFIRPARLATLRSDPSARIFTHDQWGDYLIYRLYPGHKVFVDGRSDFYGDDFEEKYIDVLNVKYGWEKPSAVSASTRFYCPRRAAGRRAEGIQPLARRLRRRHRAGLPVRTAGRGQTSIRRQ